MSVLAIIPARVGSKGIHGKNWKPLAGGSPVHRACIIAADAGAWPVISTDLPDEVPYIQADWLYAGPPLHTDTCPMIDVVKDVLARVPGPPDQQIVLLQPTQPLRKPAHITQALELLTRDVTSVVSVTPWPQEYSPELMCHIMDGRLYGVDVTSEGFGCYRLASQPTRRQDAFAGWRRDGTVYAFWRDTLNEGGGFGLYGHAVKPLIIPPEETCPLDTPQDWIEAERRLQEREG